MPDTDVDAVGSPAIVKYIDGKMYRRLLVLSSQHSVNYILILCIGPRITRYVLCIAICHWNLMHWMRDQCTRRIWMIERGDEDVRKCGIGRKRERGRGRKDEKSERSGEKALDYYLNLIGGGQFFLLHSMCSKPIESARVVVNARSFVSGFLYVVVILRFTWKRRDFRTSKMEERGKYKKYQRKKRNREKKRHLWHIPNCDCSTREPQRKNCLRYMQPKMKRNQKDFHFAIWHGGIDWFGYWCWLVRLNWDIPLKNTMFLLYLFASCFDIINSSIFTDQYEFRVSSKIPLLVSAIPNCKSIWFEFKPISDTEFQHQYLMLNG